MAYESNRPSGGSGGLIAGLLLLLLLGGIGVMGLGTYVWFRTESAKRQAAAAVERAAKEAQIAAARRQAALEQQALHADQPVDPDLPSIDRVDVVATEEVSDAAITLAEDGSVAFHGEAVTHEELASRLVALAGEDGPPAEITIWAHEDCPFHDVADVLRLCREAGIEQVRIALPGSDRGAADASVTDADDHSDG